MTSTGRARRFRMAMYAFGIAICAIVTDGWGCHLIGAVVTMAALAAYVLEDPRFFRLVLMWCAGFLLIITPEGLKEADAISRLYGADAFDTASRCLVASHFAVLFGHDLVFQETHVRPARAPWSLSLRLGVPVILFLWLVTVIYLLPVALQAYQGGRAQTSGQSQDVFTVVAEGLATSSRVLVPIAAVWMARRSRPAVRNVLLGITAVVLGLELTFGVRFVLLFIVMGSVTAWLAPHRLTRRTVATLGIVAIVLALSSAVTKNSRTFGLRDADVGDVMGDVSSDYFVMSEESVRSMTQAVVYTERRGFTDGRTTTGLLLFWVPRALWPDKPTMIGHWLPREFGKMDTGFSSAPAFTGGTYVDVGLWGSVLLWFIGGMAFGLVERWTARVAAAPEDSRMLLIAPLYGASFFAVRSPETTGIVLVGVLAGTLIFLMIAGRHRVVRRPVIARP